MTTTRPPVWFWIVVALLIGWGIVGVIGFYMGLSDSVRAQMDAYDRGLYESAPGWYMPVYGIATWAGLLGSVLLAFRRRLARPFYIVSLVAVVVMFGWTLGMTDLIVVKGFVTAAAFPIFIAAVGAFEIWLANHAARRGWIR
jgi:hypothetical protein